MNRVVATFAISLAMLLLGIGASAPQVVFAGAAVNVGNPLGESANPDEDAITTLQGRFGQLLNTMLRGLAALSLLPIAVGGFQLIISQGNEDKIKRGKQTLYFGIIGLMLAMVAIAFFQTFLSFVLQAR